MNLKLGLGAGAALLFFVIQITKAEFRSSLGSNKEATGLALFQDAVEKNMATLEAEKTALHDKLATPLPPADIAEAGKRLKAVEDELAELEVRWLELTEAMDAIESAMA